MVAGHHADLLSSQVHTAGYGSPTIARLWLDKWQDARGARKYLSGRSCLSH